MQIYCGDAVDVLKTITDGSVDCCVTSPPYFGLRDYGIEGQYGLEPSPIEYVETMRAVFAEVRRVLAADGTLWLNIGDSYSPGTSRTITRSPQTSMTSDGTRVRDRHASDGRANLTTTFTDLPPAKNLLGIPWRTAFALQDDGWILRNDIIWHKPNAMPSSVTDRMSTRYEHVFLFAKSRRYWFDLTPIREPVMSTPKTNNPALRVRNVGGRTDGFTQPCGSAHRDGKNPGDVWSITTKPFPGAHFACMAPDLVERCVLAGCKPGGVVLDPFSGSGTTGMVALRHGRDYIGIDLNPEYNDLALKTRLAA